MSHADRFKLADDAWLRDPRRSAPSSLLQLTEAAQLLAEARHDLRVVRAERAAWEGTTVMALASKYAKWPKWRVDAVVAAEPKFRYWELELAKAEQEVCVLEAVVAACTARLKLLGDFYEVRP